MTSKRPAPKSPQPPPSTEAGSVHRPYLDKLCNRPHFPVTITGGRNIHMLPDLMHTGVFPTSVQEPPPVALKDGSLNKVYFNQTGKKYFRDLQRDVIHADAVPFNFTIKSNKYQHGKLKKLQAEKALADRKIEAVFNSTKREAMQSISHSTSILQGTLVSAPVGNIMSGVGTRVGTAGDSEAGYGEAEADDYGAEFEGEGEETNYYVVQPPPSAPATDGNNAHGGSGSSSSSGMESRGDAQDGGDAVAYEEDEYAEEGQAEYARTDIVDPSEGQRGLAYDSPEERRK